MIQCPICNGDMLHKDNTPPTVTPRYRDPLDPYQDKFWCRTCEMEFRRDSKKGSMDVPTLTPQQRKERINLRNYLMTATREQLVKEKTIRPTAFRVACINELILELE